MIRLSIVIIILLFFTQDVLAQYNGSPYLNYTTAQGLASNTCHTIVKDQSGFIWIATQAGLSRFDGESFTNFTMKDGLPSNEILNLFVDSKNRLWIGSFKHTICFYQNGKFYNQDNHPELKKIDITDLIASFAETTDGSIILNLGSNFVIIPENWKNIIKVDYSPSLGEKYRKKYKILRYTGSPPLAFLPKTIQDIVNLDSNCAVSVSAKDRYILNRLYSREFFTGKGEKYRTSLTNIQTNLKVNDSIVAFGYKTRGIDLYSLLSGKKLSSHLPEYKVNNMLWDDEGIIWFTTNGSGIFQLNNPNILNYTLGRESCVITNIYSRQDTLYASSELGRLFKLDKKRSDIAFETNFSIDKLPENFLQMFSSAFYQEKDPKRIPARGTIKGIYLYSDTLLLSGSDGVFRIADKGRSNDILFNQRATSALKVNHTIYIGTLDGLYEYESNKITYRGATNPLLKSRIIYMAASSDGILWIATYENGIIGYKDHHVVAHIHEGNSKLTSNICNSLYIDKGYLWAATYQGLYKIRLGSPGYQDIERYDISDGLYSNIIESVFVQDNRVYAATENIVCSFDADVNRPRSSCKIALTGIINSGKNHLNQLNTDNSNHLILPPDRKNIRFEYTGLSFRSAGDIRYQYRLSGLDEQWYTTTDKVVSYPFLPSGKYRFEIKAINKYGVESRLAQVSFEIEPYLWETMVFKVSLMLLLIALVWLLIKWRIRVAAKTEKQKLMTERRIIELEQAALKAQMNPHFIFNCLNSIQNFIVERDIRKANFYLTKFAKLVRQTLDFSGNPMITVAQEISYLSSYLNLECMYSDHSFSFQIDTQELYTDHTSIPVMIIQPFVENAVKHGVIPLKDRKGKIQLTFRNGNDDTIHVIIEDNGCGILANNMKKNPDHNSKGTAIVINRIAIWNQLNERKIILAVDWAYTGYGTRISLTFPNTSTIN